MMKVLKICKKMQLFCSKGAPPLAKGE